MKHLRSIVEAEVIRRKELHEEERDDTRPQWRRALSRTFTKQKTESRTLNKDAEKRPAGPIGADMIRRRDTEPKRIDPTGAIVDEPASMYNNRQNVGGGGARCVQSGLEMF